jgi:hypothetical protein
MRSIRSYFTLTRIGYAFTDLTAGRSVYYYEDCYGDIWLKTSRWSLFRVFSRGSNHDSI